MQCRLRQAAVPKIPLGDILPPHLDTAEARIERRLGISGKGKPFRNR